MIILGVNAFHGDAAACVVVDGQVIAAVEEERFRRVKHWAGLPSQSIQYCLSHAALDISDVDHIAINRDPRANFLRKLFFSLNHTVAPRAILGRIKNRSKIVNMRELLAEELNIPPAAISARLHNIEHHHAHLASTYYASSFESATVISVDGFGDFSSTAIASASGNKINIIRRVFFPHSLGLFYLAITQFLGFPRYGDEYKVMGLAPYGRPRFREEMSRLISEIHGGGFRLDLSFFLHHTGRVKLEWEGGEPAISNVYSSRFSELLGPPRSENSPLLQHHLDIAASAQEKYEEMFLHVLNSAYAMTGDESLALAGGCSMNSVANGIICERTRFKNIYIPPAAGDSGGAVGAALAVWNSVAESPTRFQITNASLGPSFTNEQIEEMLRGNFETGMDVGIEWLGRLDEGELCCLIANEISNGSVVGWFQGRMEWGPRALGNRSIIGDPRRKDMKDVLNKKIKLRESFRPFAPSILKEKVGDWFEEDRDVPFMSQVLKIKQERHHIIPAVTHVNGTGRLQTVERIENPRFHRLISSFEDITGVPILLNTSFNENEPIVCRPQEALDCFLRTKMDVLVLENNVLRRI